MFNLKKKIRKKVSTHFNSLLQFTTLSMLYIISLFEGIKIIELPNTKHFLLFLYRYQTCFQNDNYSFKTFNSLKSIVYL